MKDDKDNIRSAISYVLGAFTGVIILLIEKKKDDPHPIVIFHALQSIVVLGTASIIATILNVLAPSIIADAFNTVSLALWAFLIYQAANRKNFKFPLIGKMLSR